MQIAITRSRLIDLLESQIRHNFLLEDDERPAIDATLDRALERTATCFEPNGNKYYRRDGALYFSPYQSAQYCIFLYYFANTLWRSGGAGFLCDKLYLLNKMLNGIDLFYQVELPDVFFTDHPVGTVLGRAKYGRGFSFNQGCTVGNNKGVYPVIGENVRMYSGVAHPRELPHRRQRDHFLRLLREGHRCARLHRRLRPVAEPRLQAARSVLLRARNMMAGRLCIIPARGGSKRIPRKNIREFCGRPIISYSIEAAVNAGCFDEVMISTDSEEIAEVGRKFGASIPFMRSAENSSDHATTAAVWQEVIRAYQAIGRDFSIVCSVMPTAPFVTPARLREAVERLESHPDWDAMIPVVEFAPPIQRAMKITDGTVHMIWPEHASTRSQDLEPVYHDAAQFYLFRAAYALTVKSIREGTAGTMVIPGMEAHDIDSLDDWALAEMKFRMLREAS